jgi:hypothetical protein
MHERLQPWLKIACLVLGLLLVLQLARITRARDPLEAMNLSFALPHGIGVSPTMTSNSTALRQSAATRTTPLSPRTQNQIDRIKNSEILGAVPKPLPMALLGIAGDDAFLRGPNGQSGLVRVGEELGGVKLLQIGTNRVLVEHEGERKELTLFSGFGSDSLLPK